MAFIRPYRPSDFEATAHICRATLPPSLSASEPAHRLAPYVWTHQYTHLSPQTSFVLDDGSGRAVGYCIGSGDVRAFVSDYPAYVAAVLETSPEARRRDDDVVDANELALFLPDGRVNEAWLVGMAHDPRMLLVEGNEDLDAAGYNATMHVDLLDGWQGRGWGRRLIDAFVESARVVPQKDGGVNKGIWIGVATDNSKVVPFYEKQGFKVKERGGEAKSICMTRDF